MDRLRSEEELHRLADNLHRSPVRKYGHSLFKGYFLPKGFAKIQKDIEEFEVRNDDVWVTSFPKCGTTWTMYLISCIITRHDLSKADEHFRNFHFIEFSSIYDSDDPKMPEVFRDTVGKAAKDVGRRFVKSHLPWDLLPLQIQKFQKRPKIVHIVRDPRDVCISYYYHSKLLQGYTGDFELFWQLFISGKLIWSPLPATMLSYVKHKEEPNILILKYEDMKADLRSVLIKVAEFLEVTLTEKEVNAILPKLSFEAMKANPEMSFDLSRKFMSEVGIPSDLGIDFIRKGKTGQYKLEMGEDVVALLNERMVVPLAEGGLDYKVNL